MKKSKTISIILFILFVSAGLVLFRDYLSLEAVKENKEALFSFISQNYLYSILIFIILGAIIASIPAPLVALVEITSGFLFGFFVGIFCTIAAVVCGSVIAFLTTRHLFRDTHRNRHGKTIAHINEAIRKNGFSYFSAMRLAVVFPYFLINIFGGLSDISFRKYFLSTVIGVVPSAIIYGYAGSILETIKSPEEIFSPQVYLAIAAIVSFSLLPVLVRHIKDKRKLAYAEVTENTES